jgi:4-hydroxybenzoate polyprenyltransferase
LTSEHDSPRPVRRNGLIRFGRLVRFSHTVFALPFALAGLALATTVAPFHWQQLLWVLAAMVTARSAAMGFNRIVDRHFDARNPRTKIREIPSGQVSVTAAVSFVVASSAAFFFSAFMLNPLCGWLSPVALAIVFFYSLTKRFTWTSQFFLGLSLAVAPVGAWLAVTGGFEWRIFILAGIVLLWVAGFDIFYAIADVEFDRAAGLFSMPQRWGVRRAILIARILHLCAAALILCLPLAFDLGAIYLTGALVVVAILAVEDFLVDPDDTRRTMLAFNLNGAVSILFFLAILADIWL